MALNPALSGILGVAGVAAGGAEFALPLPPPPAPLLAPPTTWSTAALLWLRSFSSRRHLARRLLNHTCEHRANLYVTRLPMITITAMFVYRLYIL